MFTAAFDTVAVEVTQMSTNGWIYKQNVIYTHGILFSLKKEILPQATWDIILSFLRFYLFLRERERQTGHEQGRGRAGSRL